MLRGIIIDDEAAAIKTLSLLIKKYIQEVNIIDTAASGKTGILSIEKHQPDIVFLDVSMPDMTGFALLQELRYKDFFLVFTTAHEKYAIEAIRHHATDYLVKPIDIDELKRTVHSIIELKEKKDSPAIINDQHHNPKLSMNSRISLPIRDGLVYYMVSDILWIESNGNYSTFHMADSMKYLVSKNLGEYEDILPDTDFFRAHKSFLINIRRVKKYIRTDGYFAEMGDGSVIEIARRKKDDFLNLMNKIPL